MSNYPLKFIDLVNLCKNFGLIYHKAFYNICVSIQSDKINRLNILKNKLIFMMNEFMQNDSTNLMKYHYDFLLDGTNHVIYNIASSAIMIMHANDILIYDIFGDIFYCFFDNKMYINNLLYTPNVNNNNNIFFGNLQCEVLQFVFYKLEFIKNHNIINSKLKELLNI